MQKRVEEVLRKFAYWRLTESVWLSVPKAQ